MWRVGRAVGEASISALFLVRKSPQTFETRMQFLLKENFWKQSKNGNIWFLDIRRPYHFLLYNFYESLLFLLQNCKFHEEKIYIWFISLSPQKTCECSIASCWMAIIQSAIYFLPIVQNPFCSLIIAYSNPKKARALNDCQGHNLILF